MDQLAATRHADRIRELEETWLDAVRRHDVDALLAIYAPDAQELLPGQPPFVGREAIAGYYRDLLARHPRAEYRRTLDEVTIAESGDLAIVRGAYHFSADAGDAGDADEPGKFIGVWIFVSGDWRLQTFISNSDEAGG